MIAQDEVIVLRVNAFGSSVESGLAKPNIGFGIIMKNSTALLDSKGFRPMERQAHELSRRVHIRRKPPSRIPDGIRLQLIHSRPQLRSEFHRTPGMNDRHRNPDVRVTWYLYLLHLVQLARQQDSHRATVHRHAVRRTSVFRNRRLEVANDIKGSTHMFPG